ncbi:MAG: hypothetical protein SNJ62_04765 [Chloracidobacterium sp.]
MNFAHAWFHTLWQRNARRTIAVGCALAAVLPILTTPFPPATDLPQHVAQVRLWFETWAGVSQPNGVRYVVQWWTPYSLAYLVMGGLWQLLPPVRVGQAMLVVLAVAWTLTVHWVAARRSRSAAAAALATTLFFNHTLYWGFVSFAAGMPLFLLWLHTTTTDAPLTRRRQAWLVGLAAALYAAHALWFALALVWFGLAGVALRRPWRTLVYEGIWLLPLIALAGLMYSQIGQATTLVEHKTIWLSPVGWRLFTPWLPASVYGGLRGWLEPVALGILGAWMAAGWLYHRHQVSAATDPALLLAGGLCLAAGLVLPYQYQYTIELAERWMPMAATGWLLGSPGLDAPTKGRLFGMWRLPVWRLQAVAVAGCVAFCGWTALVWQAFHRSYLPGLPDALSALPPRPRVVGLDFVKEIPAFTRRPLMQMPAYAQVVQGGGYSLSFAKFPQSFVRYETDTAVRWTDGLEWSPERLTELDLAYFDFALVVGDRWAHERLQVRFPRLQLVTGDGQPWRLYRVTRPASPDR